MIPTKLFAVALIALAGTSALAGQARRATPAPAARQDLADIAAGTYAGAVISDSRGSGQSDVTITVTKIGPNKISVTSSYRRLGTFTVGLIRAMQTIQAGPGYGTNFLLDLSRHPNRLDLNVDGASWSGERQ